MIKRSVLIAGFAAASALPLLSAGCGSGGGTTTVLPIVATTPTPLSTPSPSPTPIPIDAPVSATGRYQNLVLTLSAPHSVYKAGDTAQFTLTVENTGSEDVSAGSAALFMSEADYPNASAAGGMTSVSGSVRLFPVETVFKADETVTIPIDRQLTAFTQPLTYRVFGVSVNYGSLINDPNAIAPGTPPIGLTVLQ